MSLETIVQNMVTAKEPEANIAKVIRHYNQINSSPLNQIEEVETVVAEETPECDGIGMVWSESAQRCVPEENQQKYNDFNKGIFKTDEKEEYDEFIKNREGTQNQTTEVVEESSDDWMANLPSQTEEDIVARDAAGNIVTEEYDPIAEKEAIAAATIQRNMNERYAKREDPSTGEQILESIVTNFPPSLEKAFTDTYSGSYEILRGLFGEEALEDWAKGEGPLAAIKPFTGLLGQLVPDREKADDLIRKSRVLKSEMSPWVGDFIDQDFDGDGKIDKKANIPAAIVDGITSIGSSAAVNTVTLGTGLIPMMAGDFYVEYNEELAAQKGITLKELRDRKEDKVFDPLLIGVIAGISERFGIKGAGAALMKKVGSKGLKGLVHRMASGSKEGITEVIQYGLEMANKVLAKEGEPLITENFEFGKTQIISPKATDAFVNGITSKQSWNAFLKGFVGGGVLSGKGQNISDTDIDNAIGSLRAPADLETIEKGLDKLSTLQQDLKRARSPITKKGIEENIKNVTTEVKNAIVKGNSLAPKMTPKEISQVNNLSDLGDLQIERVTKLQNEYKEGRIQRKEYLAALEGYTDTYLETKNKLQDISTEVEARESAPESTLGKEVLVEEETDSEGRTYKRFATTTEKDGVKTTTYTFNRSDKDTSQRNKTAVKPENAFGDELEIDPDSDYNDVLTDSDSKMVGVENIMENPNPRADQAEFQADVVVEHPNGGRLTLIGLRLRRKSKGPVTTSKQDALKEFNKIAGELSDKRKSGELTQKQYEADVQKNRRKYNDTVAAQKKTTKTFKENVKGVKESSVKASKKLQEVFDKGVKEGDITKDKAGKNVIGDKSMKQILDTQLPFIKKLTNTVWNNTPPGKRIKDGGKEQLESNITSGVGGFYDLLRTYNGKIPLGAYLQQQLRKRAISEKALDGVSNQQFQQDMASSEVQGMIAEEDGDIDAGIKNIETAQALSIGEELINKFKKAAERALLTSKEKVDNTKFKSDIAQSFKNDLYSEIKKALNLKDTKNNKGLTKAIEETPEAFYDSLSIESMRMARSKDGSNPFETAGLLKRENGVLKKRKFSKETAKKFKDYFINPKNKEGKDVGKSTKSDRQMNLIEALAVSMGAREGMSLLENDVEFRQRFAEQQQQEQNKEIAQKAAEKIASNKDKEKFINKVGAAKFKLLEYVSSKVRDIRGVIKKLGYTYTPINNKTRRALQKKVLDFIKKGNIPVWVLNAAQFGYGGALNKNVSADGFKGKIDNKKYRIGKDKNGIKIIQFKDKSGKWKTLKRYDLTDGNTILNNDPKFAEHRDVIGDLVPAKNKLYYGKTDPAYQTALREAKKNDKKNKDFSQTKQIKKGKGETITKSWLNSKPRGSKLTRKEQAAYNMDALIEFLKVLNKAVHENGMDFSTAAMFITSSYQATTGLFKIAYPFKYISKNPQYGKTEKYKKGSKTMEEHNPPVSSLAGNVLVAMEANALDLMIPSIRKNVNQTQLSKRSDEKLAEAGFDAYMPDKVTILDDPSVRFARADIDLDGIENIETGKTMAQENKAQGPNTVDGIAASNQVVIENNSDQIENLIDRAISKLTELTGSKGTLQMNLASIPVNVLIGGLRAVKLAYQSGKTLVQAIEKGYSKIKDYMSAQEWADFVSKSTQEVKNEKNPAQVKLAILSEKGVAQIQEQSRKTDEALLKEFGIEIDGLSTDQIVEKLNILRKAKSEASDIKNPTKKARVFDFDDTLAKTKSKVGYTLPDGTSGNLDATQFAEQYESLKEAGATFDYSEFNKVKDGTKGPLANLAKRFTEALGDRDVFILTSRPAAAAPAIQEFLRSTLGISIPLKNISGIENGTPGAKALWIAEKVSEKYNDIFFADDSKANVDAVKKMLTDLGVTNKVQQAKEGGQKTLEDEMDSLIRTNKPSKIGRILNKLNIYIPPGADDFAGLLSYFVGSGKTGEQQQKWFKDNLLDPFGKGINAWTSAKVSLANDYKALKKRFKNKKLLAEKVLGGLYTKEQAVRAYLYNKAEQDLGLNKADTQDLIDLVEGNADLKAFADELSKITKLENGYPNITENWLGGNIGTDVANAANSSLREMFLQDFINNKNQIFTDQNLKLIKQAYGDDFTDALNNVLERMTTGINRKKGKDREFNTVMNWINQSVGAVMAINMRSAILQQLSIVNYTNWSFNNPFMVAKAMANVPQFLKDYAKIWNSPFLKERRGGMSIDVNMTDIADSNPGNLFLRMNKKILELGFKPTQWGDSNAISFGGASWYRNKVNRLIKEGMSKEDAETQAMVELRELSEEHQQSSRPDRISRQQSSDIGRLILAFANTPLQLARSTKKATGDLIYRRGDAKTNMSKILYYGFAQSLIFAALQQGLFSLFADDDDEIDEKEQKKLGYAINSVIDGLLRGVGFAGATISALKNLAMEYYAQYEKRKAGKYVRDGSLRLIQKGLTVSPPISKKIGDIVEAQKFETWRQYKNDPFYQGFAVANYVSGLTNVPVDRVFKKIENLKAASDDKTQAWQSVFLALGWSPYNVDLQWPERPPKKTKKKKKKTKNNSIITPLNALQHGVLGKANKDGSIEVASGLSPKKEKEVIDHEKRHQKEMRSGKLDYDDNFVYYGKKKFARENGRIAHAGKWKPEGDHSLPWEKFAHNVNNKIT